MIDITKKYWIDYGPIAVKCSITYAYVSFNLQKQKLFSDDDISSYKGIEDLDISEEAKRVFLNQKEEGYGTPNALTDKPETIKALKEIESLGYIVFYEVDEPIGRTLNEDDLVLDETEPSYFVLNKTPKITLHDARKKRWEGICSHYIKSGLPEPKMPNYPNKVYGYEWYEFEEEEEI